MCSSEMLVSTWTRDRGSTFVASSRPPRPASTTPHSTPAASNAQNAAAVSASNCVTRVPAASRTRSTASSYASGAISAPRIRIRSRNDVMCGER